MAVHYLVCCYDPRGPSIIPNDLLQVTNITWIFERGIIAQFIHKHASPNLILTNPDYVMILLDDIELNGQIPWHDINKFKNYADIFSPTLTKREMSYWPFMITKESEYCRIQNVCELFCYVMTFETYKHYYTYIDPDNPWMWGMDFLLKRTMGLRSVLFNNWTMNHYYWRKIHDTVDPNHDPRKDSERYIEKHAPGVGWAGLHKDQIIVAQILI